MLVFLQNNSILYSIFLLERLIIGSALVEKRTQYSNPNYSYRYLTLVRFLLVCSYYFMRKFSSLFISALEFCLHIYAYASAYYDNIRSRSFSNKLSLNLLSFVSCCILLVKVDASWIPLYY